MSAEGHTNAPKPAQEAAQPPVFIREFSRENSAEERTELAQKIRAERAEHSQERHEQSELEQQLAVMEKQLDEYNSSSFLAKARDYFKMRAVKESLGMTQARKAEIDASVASRDPNAAGQDAIGALYEREKGKWANAEYGKEDIAKLFTEEHLASLSVEDYALLLKRFPSEMVTHVTRQGIRDHNGMYEHSAGMDEFHNGFEKMLDEGVLKSPLSIKLAEGGKEETVLKILRSKDTKLLPKTREEALAQLDSFMNSGNYADRAAVHFAAEEVADHYYGSEKGNEIFIAYPSAFIGSQYHFSHGDIVPEHIGDQHNDAWVLSQEDQGMQLDAGLVFIPKEAQVNPKTGSRYEIGPDKKPLKNTAVFENLQKLMKSPDISAYTTQIRENLVKVPSGERLPIPSTWEAEVSKPEDKSYAYKDVLEALLPVRNKIIEITGISDDRVLGALFDYMTAVNIDSAVGRYDPREREGDLGRAIDDIMEKSGTRFSEASETVSSEEYWNAYFAAHPDKKPSKVVFYSGGDPSKALYEWRRSNGLTKKSSDRSAGFGEHKADTAEAEVAGIQNRADRFRSLASGIIEEIYQNMPSEAAQPEVAQVPSSEEGFIDDDELPPPLPPEDVPVRRPPPPPPVF